MSTATKPETAEERLTRFMAAFEARFGKANISGTVCEFYGYEEDHMGLWVSGEGGNEVHDSVPAFDYYSDGDHLASEAAAEFGHKPLPPSYDGGIHKDAAKWLHEYGAHAEWHDPGTVFIYLDNPN